MQVQRLIQDFRELITDNLAPYRFSDEEALGFFNRALAQLAKHIPTLFTVSNVLTLSPGSRHPRPAAHLQIFNLICNREGPSLSSPMGPIITEVPQDIMTAVSKTWMTDNPANTVEHLVQLANANEYFYVYPPIESVGYVEAYYNVEPPMFTSSVSEINLPRRYLDALPFMMAYLSYLPDNGSEGNTAAAKGMYGQYLLCISANIPQETIA